MDPVLQFFAYDHLPDRLKEVRKPFGDLAQWMVDNLPRNPERTAGLRKFLEAKDVRLARVSMPTPAPRL